jgi:hypothetical protein
MPNATTGCRKRKKNSPAAMKGKNWKRGKETGEEHELPQQRTLYRPDGRAGDREHYAEGAYQQTKETEDRT